MGSGDAIFPGILKLMALLDLSADSHTFNYFYDFIFLICRENGQKSISVSRAVTAWKLVLNGRFRLLDQWCDFVEKHQRHNISEDTWQQLLAFSRCVNENLEGYDPKGAWPILIDDFVEHLYRVKQANNCSSRETQPEMWNCYSGLAMTPGSKRKFLQDMLTENSTMSTCMTKSKRVKQIFSANNGGCDGTMNICDNTPADIMGTHHLQTSACAVEDSLSKGFKGHLSIGPCFQFN